MFKKIDGYYWVKTSETSKVGYPSLIALLWEEYNPQLFIAINLVAIAVIFGVSY